MDTRRQRSTIGWLSWRTSTSISVAWVEVLQSIRYRLMGEVVIVAASDAARWSRGDLGPRGTYRQKQQHRIPRAIPDEQFEALFGALGSDRDRAIVSLFVSSGAWAAELLSMTGQDVDWGNQRVRLITKGTREASWAAASDDFLRWLARYIARERPPLEANGPLWVTLRRPPRPLAYGALRAVWLRINEQLGANWTLHDFRHTCGMRLAADPTIPVIDVQAHLRHRHLSTTETYLNARPEDVIRRVQAHQRASPPATPSSATGWTYQADDLATLFGERTQ